MGLMELAVGFVDLDMFVVCGVVFLWRSTKAVMKFKTRGAIAVVYRFNSNKIDEFSHDYCNIIPVLSFFTCSMHKTTEPSEAQWPKEREKKNFRNHLGPESAPSTGGDFCCGRKKGFEIQSASELEHCPSKLILSRIPTNSINAENSKRIYQSTGTR